VPGERVRLPVHHLAESVGRAISVVKGCSRCQLIAARSCATVSHELSTTVPDKATVSALARGDRLGKTVIDDGGTDSLTGGRHIPRASGWFFQGVHDTIHNYESGEQIN
jgi:hypothetical protein